MSTNPERERGEVKNVYRMLAYNPYGYFVRFAIWWFIFSILVYLLVSAASPGGVTENWDQEYGLSAMLSIIMTAWLTWRVRMVVRENGVEFHGMFNDLFGRWRPHTFTTWKNVSHIEIQEESDGEGGTVYKRILILKQPFRKKVDLGKILRIRTSSYHTGRWFSRTNYTVVDYYALAQSDFGKDLVRYAPHVLEVAQKEEERVAATVQEYNKTYT